MRRGAALRRDRPHCSGVNRPLQGESPSQCPFGVRQAGDTTGPKKGEKRSKIAFENKGLMNAISFVRETKSDIDWF